MRFKIFSCLGIALCCFVISLKPMIALAINGNGNGNGNSNKDSCASFPCQNNGVCRIQNVTDYTCNCDPKIAYGLDCENLNPCYLFPCKHGGTCTAKDANYTCSCIKSAYGNSCQYYKDPATNSTILNLKTMQLLRNILEIPLNISWELLYQASVDGFENFHSKCDGVKNTLVVIKSASNNVFGGYTTADWSLPAFLISNSSYIYDASAFLFSLVNKYKSPVKMSVKTPENAIYTTRTGSGPIFGSGFDIFISSKGNGYSNMNGSYQVPNFLDPSSYSSFLGGSSNFETIEVEVFKLKIDFCFSKPCQNDGVCSNLENSYLCNCPKRFFGKNCQYKSLNSDIFINSLILNNRQSKQLVDLINFPKNLSYQKIHQASADGFSGRSMTSTFRKYFRNLTGCLILIKSNYSTVFGGYAERIPYFDFDFMPLYDSSAFLFSLINNFDSPVKISPISTYGAKMPFFQNDFGINTEFTCGPQYAKTGVCHSEFGVPSFSQYKAPSFLTRFDNSNNYGTASTFLGGGYYFELTELEIYSVNGYIDPCLIDSCQNRGLCSSNYRRIICSCVDGYYGERCQHKQQNSTTFLSSTILNDQLSQKLVDLIGFKTQWNLAYRASDGAMQGYPPCYKLCGKPNVIHNTITIIKTSNSFVFGGFTSINSKSLNSRPLFKYDENAFLFSLVNDHNTPVRMNITPSHPAIMVGFEFYQFILGQTDLPDSATQFHRRVFNGVNTNIDASDLHVELGLKQGYSDIGRSYQLPSFLLNSKNKTNVSKIFLAGAEIFYPIDIEVYSSTDQCLFNPCKNGGICSQSSSSYNCICQNGLYGRNCEYKRLNSTLFKNSTILTNEQSIQLANLINLNQSDSSIKLLYQGSIDGFLSQNLYSKLKSLQGGLIVAKSTHNNIFGVYTEANLDLSKTYLREDANAFMFSLVNIFNSPVTMNIIDQRYALGISDSSGPMAFLDNSLTLLSGFIPDAGGSCRSSSLNYQIPSFLDTSKFSNRFLGGDFNFELFDIELYSIPFIDPCKIHPCKNGGICIAKGRDSTCSCINGYVGQLCAFKRVDSKIFPNSTFLTNDLSMKLVNLTGLLNKTWKLIYQASVDGFSSASFHSKCNRANNTLIVIKSNKDYIFGGYTTADWTPIYYNVNDKNAFLFNLVNEYNFPVKMKVLSPEYAIHNTGYKNDGIHFYDFFCKSGNKEMTLCEQTTNGGVYEASPYYKSETLIYDFPTQNSFPRSFQAVEIEVYTNN